MNVMGSLLRAVVLAVVIAVIAGIIGAVATLTLCSGGCSWANDASDLVGQNAPGLGIDMATLLGGLVLVGLAIALTPRDPVISLAGIFSALIAGLAFLVWLPRPTAPTPAPEPEPQPQPAQTMATAATTSCAVGSFARNGICTPCFETRSEQLAPKLNFDAIRTDAHWQYARADRVMLNGQAVSVDAMINSVATSASLCSAPAVLVYGSASADGARDRNIIRAKDRAENLAEAVRKRCSRSNPSIKIYALSLGQSEAAEDLAEDRAISIAKIEPIGTGSDDLTGSVILDELGYSLSEGTASVPLLARRERFPKPWNGPAGAASTVQVKPRPSRTVEVLASDAPASCSVKEDAEALDLPTNTRSTFDEGGLDPRMSLRQ